MKYDYFIASRYRNKVEVLRLTHLLRESKKTVYSFVESEASLKHVGKLEGDVEEQMAQLEAKENWREDSGVKEMFTTDMDALQSSSTLILLLPAGKSAHLEAGIAYGMKKKCIIIGEQKETETNYLIFSEMYSSIDAFISALV